MKTAEFLSWANKTWPESEAEDWDNPGLITGDLATEHSRVLLAVDITNDVLDEAIKNDCSLVVAHHPLLLGGVDSLREDLFKGQLLAKAIRNNLTLFAAHTNADIVSGGVSDSLAKKLGMRETHAIDGNSVGHGRVGRVRKQSLKDLTQKIIEEIPSTARGVSFIGDLEMQIESVALVAGSGMSFVDQVSADVFITSDVKHHSALDFKEQVSLGGPKALIDISHFAAESVWLEGLSMQITDIGLEAIVSEINTDPWDGVIR